jgi:hypothetical protein
VRERGFGVFRFFEDLAGRYSCFEFLHGHGLGVIAVGSEVAPSVQRLCELGESPPVLVLRERFAQMGSLWETTSKAWERFSSRIPSSAMPEDHPPQRQRLRRWRRIFNRS